MKYKTLAIAAVLAACLQLPSAAADAQGAGSPPGAKAEKPCPCAPKTNGSWEQIIQEALADGKCFKNPEQGTRYAQFADYPPGSGLVAINSPAGKSTDFFIHELAVLCEREPSGKVRGLGILASMLYRIPGFGSESFNFRVSASGELLRAFMTSGADSVKPGGHDATVLDIKDPQVLERFRHVEDVWLRGMYWRKKKGADKAPAQEPPPKW